MSLHFQKYYATLNAAQKQAVDTIEGPVMVIAGPGTGKTQILTLRIANIVRTSDTDPGNILALTFTESGVKAMRARLSEMMGSAAYRVAIHTFHGFCNGVIQSYPEEFPHIIGARHIGDVEQVALYEELITTLPLEVLRPYGDTFYYLHDIKKAIETLKREGVSPEIFTKLTQSTQEDFSARDDLYHEKGAHKGKMKGAAIAQQKAIAKQCELATVYQVYQEALAIKKYYDYSDMIMEVYHALERNEDLLRMLQEQYHYILVDEHQDTNNAQNKIIELLCNFHDNPNLFVVGDDKQAIFRFQGASVENFYYFKHLYPEAVIIPLEENYRSSQLILDYSHDILAGKVALKARAGHVSRPIELRVFTDPAVEMYHVAQDIKTAIAQGVPPEEIAVLYRDNKEATAIAEMLIRHDILHRIESDSDILTEPVIKKIITILSAVHDFPQPHAVFEAMHLDTLQIAPLDCYKLMKYYRTEAKGRTVYEVVQDEEFTKDPSLMTLPQIKDLLEKVQEWKKTSKNKGFQELFQQILQESGLLPQILASDQARDELEVMRILMNDIAEHVAVDHEWGIKEFFEVLETRRTHGVALKRSTQGKEGGVRLMTAHRSKGLEFEWVYIVGLIDGRWGGRKKKEYLPLPDVIYHLKKDVMADTSEDDHADHDERKLFYVALTRAKKHVSLSYASHNISGKEQVPSQYIQDIRTDLVTVCPTDSITHEFLTHQEIVLRPHQRLSASLADQAFIRETFDAQPLAVTALNNYLTCPWKYFYRNLVRLPEAKAKHQLYGTAVHNALKDFFDARAKGRPTSKDYLITRFTTYLEKESLTPADMVDSKEKGIKALSGYLDFYADQWPTRVEVEYDVKKVMLDDVWLTGKIDKIEYVGTGDEVNVVDYKTGKPKSRNEIEGATQSSHGDIKRQLIFYKILLDGMDPRKYRMVSGEIDFIEPDAKGVYRKESFVVTPEEVAQLKEEIVRSAAEIRTAAFWDRRCEEKDCEFCALRDSMAS